VITKARHAHFKRIATLACEMLILFLKLSQGSSLQQIAFELRCGGSLMIT